MNSGKINRVKAILMHLTRCIIDFELKNSNKSNFKTKINNEIELFGVQWRKGTLNSCEFI